MWIETSSIAEDCIKNQTPAEARRALEKSGGNAPGAPARHETDAYQPQGLSL
jgi:putative transposase